MVSEWVGGYDSGERWKKILKSKTLKRIVNNVYIYYIHITRTYIVTLRERIGEYLNRRRVYPVKSTSTKGENDDPELSTRLILSFYLSSDTTPMNVI